MNYGYGRNLAPGCFGTLFSQIFSTYRYQPQYLTYPYQPGVQEVQHVADDLRERDASRRQRAGRVAGVAGIL